MIGREEKYKNDLFYVCSLIELIARETKNKRDVIVDTLGKDEIKKIYHLADVYHSEDIHNISREMIEKFHIEEGCYDTVVRAKYSVPSFWDIGKVYKRLILGISREEEISLIDALFLAYHSFVSEKIDDYNSSFYYEIPQNILNAYIDGYIE